MSNTPRGFSVGPLWTKARRATDGQCPEPFSRRKKTSAEVSYIPGGEVAESHKWLDRSVSARR